MDQPALFPEPTRVDPPEQLSADRRRTQLQRQLVAIGVHPLTRGRAHPELGTCGTCPHRVLENYHDRTYPKCELGPRTNGAATDVRAHWPGCHRHPGAEG